MPQGGARGQILGHLKKSFFFYFFFLLCNQAYLKNRYPLRVDLVPVTSDSRVFFFAFLSFAESFVVEQHTLQLLKGYRIKFQIFAAHARKDALINETFIQT